MPIANPTFQARLKAVREIISDCQVDGIIFTDINNISYLSGFTGSDGVLILSTDNARILVDGRYMTQAASETQKLSIVQYQNKNSGIIQALKELCLEKVGFEAAYVSVEMYEALTNSDEYIKWLPLSTELKMLRARKDSAELSLMKRAAEIASGAIGELARSLQPGWTEREAAVHVEMTARRAGAEQIAFETIVASGENAALPHARPGNRKIRRGDFVVIDFGVKYNNYCSDETCTFAIGELTGDQKNAYRAVLRAHDEAIASIRAGIAAADVDALVRRVLGEKYGRYFVHGTGHGVGLEVHEAPRLAPNSPDVLNAGMVLTVEPGLYYPGAWGIRIEDTVFVKENGCDVITKMNKELIIIK